MMRLKIALRNILRNRRRTILNLTMIAGGFSAIVLFQGFAAQMLEQLTDAAINNQFGHVQVAKNNFWDQKADETSKQRAMENPQDIINKLTKIPGVEYVSGRITFYGLLSTGDQTISAQFVGFDPKVEKRMQKGLRVVEGKNFSELDLSTHPVLGGKGLIKMLNGKLGQDLTILSHTFDGVINAIDVRLEGIFLTTMVEIDDTTIYMTLETAQRLLDTSSVDRLVVLANEDKNLEKLKKSMIEVLPSDYRPRVWKELAVLFKQVEDFYSVQNMVIEVIILLLVLLSISNTVGMSIFERTGEIGTLRALGDTSGDIIKSFCLEGLILGVIGSLLGTIMAIILTYIINFIAIPVVIPGASVPLPLIINFLPQAYFLSGILLMITTITATYVPSAKIAGMNIVDALRHNI